MIITDIWGGEGSQDHVARYVLPVDQALTLAKTELEQGFLVNLRLDVGFGPEHNFDNRISPIRTNETGEK